MTTMSLRHPEPFRVVVDWSIAVLVFFASVKMPVVDCSVYRNVLHHNRLSSRPASVIILI